MSSARAKAISIEVQSNYHSPENFGKWKKDLFTYLYTLLSNIEPDATRRKNLILGDNGANMQMYWMRAFTHYSMNEPRKPTIDYEELELLGDRVMGLQFTDYIVDTLGYLDKGSMSHLKNFYMSRQFQPTLTLKIELQKYIRIKSPEGSGIILDNGILTDLIEAFFGALYRAAPNRAIGAEYTYRFMKYLFSDVKIDLRIAGTPNKSLIIELFKTLGYAYRKDDINLSSFVLTVEQLENNMKRLFIQLNSKMVNELNEKMKGAKNIGELPGKDQGYILAEVKARSYHVGESQLYANAIEALAKIGYTKSFVDRQAGYQEITAIDEELGKKAILKSIQDGWEYIRFKEPDKDAKSGIVGMMVVSLALNGINIENQGTVNEKVIRQIITPFITNNCDVSDYAAYNACIRNIKIQLLRYYIGDITVSDASNNKAINVNDIVNNEATASAEEKPAKKQPAKTKEKEVLANVLKGRVKETIEIEVPVTEKKSPVKGRKSAAKGKQKMVVVEESEAPEKPLRIAPYGEGFCDIDLYKNFLSESEVDNLIKDIEKNVNFGYSYFYIRGRPGRGDVQYGWIADDSSWTYAFSKFHVNPLVPQKWSKELLKVKGTIENLLGVKFNAVLVNKYTGSDTLSYHHDSDPWLGDSFVVASVSMGQERKLSLRKKEDAKKKVSEYKQEQIEMPSGSLLVMHQNVQENCEHGVLDKPGRGKTFGIRYNLTFRNVVEPELGIKPNKTKISAEDIMKQADAAKDGKKSGAKTVEKEVEEEEDEIEEEEAKPKKRTTPARRAASRK
jgi:dsRNA-specific ribonuclease/alkylated DNA repair dioxygenase AlkB